MSLVADYGESSGSSSTSDIDSSDSEDLSKTENHHHEPSAPKEKLPTPNFDGSVDTNLPKTSVFKNHFTEEENAKEAVLQKHVKMVETKGNVVVINGKKICWNYRKGRCRFGHNCKFAHDSDIQKTTAQLESEKQIQQTVVCENQKLPQPSTQELDKIREESISMNQQKRKRPGLTQGITPGKRVMKQYLNQKS